MSNTLFCKPVPFRKEHLLLCAKHYVLIKYNIIWNKIKYLTVLINNLLLFVLTPQNPSFFHNIEFVRNFPSPRERVEFQVKLCET